MYRTGWTIDRQIPLHGARSRWRANAAIDARAVTPQAVFGSATSGKCVHGIQSQRRW